MSLVNEFDSYYQDIINEQGLDATNLVFTGLTDGVIRVSSDTLYGGSTTTDLTEGSNLYYTSARFNSAFAAKTTTDLTEGSNLYYTSARFNSAFAAKTTTDLTEGSNLYYLDSRSRAAISATGSYLSYSSSTGVISSTISDSIIRGLLSGGTGISYNSSTGVIDNTGVLSITGTANQVIVTGTTTPTLSLPQSIATTSGPTFNTISITDNILTGYVAGVSNGLWLPKSSVYGKPSLQSITSGFGVDDLYINPAGGNNIIGSASNNTTTLKQTNTNTSIGGGGGGMILQNTSNTTNALYEIFFNGSSGAYAEIAGCCTNQGSSFGDLIFATRSAAGYGEKMRLLSTGYLGLGINSPTSKLHIYDAAFSDNYVMRVNGALLGNLSSTTGAMILSDGYKSPAKDWASAVNLYVYDNVSTSKVITYNYGLAISMPAATFTGAGAITNNYGLYVDMPVSGTNKYAALFGGTTLVNGALAVPNTTGYVQFNSSNLSMGNYSISCVPASGNYPLRFVSACDSSTTRPFQFGYYASDNPASTFTSTFEVNAYTGNSTLTGSLSIDNTTNYVDRAAHAVLAYSGNGTTFGCTNTYTKLTIFNTNSVSRYYTADTTNHYISNTNSTGYSGYAYVSFDCTVYYSSAGSQFYFELYDFETSTTVSNSRMWECVSGSPGQALSMSMVVPITYNSKIGVRVKATSGTPTIGFYNADLVLYRIGS